MAVRFNTDSMALLPLYPPSRDHEDMAATVGLGFHHMYTMREAHEHLFWGLKNDILLETQ